MLTLCTAILNQLVHYHIRSSVNVTIHCPGVLCLTLAQFAAILTSYLANETLSLLPGNHSLDRELTPSNVGNFPMTKVIGGNGTVFVE